MSLWSPTHHKECVLPLNPPGNTTRMCLNQEQRNVFIWNSLPSQVGTNGLASQFQLLASLWVDNGSQSLERGTLYRWLRSMCTTGGAETAQFLLDSSPVREFRLFQLPQDPRTGGPFPVVDTDLNQYTPVLASTSLISAGHYIIAGIRQAQNQQFAELASFSPHLPVIATRKVSQSGTKTGGVHRNDQIRIDVRRRDLRCRATGQPAPSGSRGYNFVGLEVAHIFPLAAVDQFKDAFTFSQPHQANLYIPLNIPKFPRSKHIDIVQNALVLRGDVHSQFDAYQFAFEPSMNHQTHRLNVPRLRLFERDGAPSISRKQHHHLQPAQSNINPDIHPLLLTQHFLTALLWHVAGNGLKANDNAIIPDLYSGPNVVSGHARN